MKLFPLQNLTQMGFFSLQLTKEAENSGILFDRLAKGEKERLAASPKRKSSRNSTVERRLKD